MTTKSHKPLFRILLVAGLLLGGGGLWFYRIVYLSNVELGAKHSEYFYVHTGWTYADVLNSLEEHKIIKSRSSFDWVSKLKKYDKNIKPGRYRILENMSNRALINMLRKGEQEPVHFTLNAVHSKQQLASRVGGKLEADSLVLLHMLNDDAYLSRFGMNSNTILTLFVPETYEFYWTTSAEEFMDRMAKEYKKFWTDDRKSRAHSIGLSQTEVITLASIVQEEQSRYDDEKPVIAGVYLNRIHDHMPLQSDPTVRFVLGDYTVNRILSEDLHIESPYNTYLHTGLPPGPICFPEASSVDAVLNHQKHKYLYMCAEFGTGRHNFAETFEQHKANARRYREALDEAGIKR
jgi:UPF0755 protein